MSNTERGGQLPLNPHDVMDDLMMQAGLRLGEAMAKQAQDPYSVWFTEGTDSETQEYLAWYRLGESRELAKRGSEILDIGIVAVRASGAELLEVKKMDDSERHFYIAKPQLATPRRMAIGEQNSLRVVRPRRQRVRHGVDVTPVSGLSTKLRDYPLRPLRVRHES